MMKQLLLVCLLLPGLNGFSQYGTLLVSDMDDPATALEGVSVYNGTELLGRTDHVGAFRFSKKIKGTVTLSHPDYDTRTVSVKMKEGESKDVLLSLNRQLYAARKDSISAMLYAKCLPDSLPVVPIETVGNAESRKAFADYMAQSRYPQRAIENGEEGIVEVAFLVDPFGNVTCVEVLKSVSFELDKEAVRMVALTSGWVPAKKNGVAVASVYKAAVPFVLPGKKR